MSKRMNARELVEIGREWERSLQSSGASYRRLQGEHKQLCAVSRELARFIDVLIESDPNWGNLAVSEEGQERIADAIKEILEATQGKGLPGRSVTHVIMDDPFEEGGK